MPLPQSWQSAIKSILLIGLLAMSLFFTAARSVSADPSLAPAIDPAPLFEIHCAGCHPAGGNIIRRGKTLKQKALTRYGMDNADAIANIITHGKGVMSAFEDRLSTAEIEALAGYVLSQAETDWQ